MYLSTTTTYLLSTYYIPIPTYNQYLPTTNTNIRKVFRGFLKNPHPPPVSITRFFAPFCRNCPPQGTLFPPWLKKSFYVHFLLNYFLQPFSPTQMNPTTTRIYNGAVHDGTVKVTRINSPKIFNKLIIELQ